MQTGEEQRDVDLFRVGQTVWIRPRGDRTVTQRTILAIDRDTDRIVFSGGHNLVGPYYGTVDIPEYSSADAVDQARWAFFGRGYKYI